MNDNQTTNGTETTPQIEQVSRPVDVDVRQIALVVFDGDEANLYGRGSDGRINYDQRLPWPHGWPSYITGRFLQSLRIPWMQA